MIIFTIENESNNIIAHTTIQEAEAVPNAERLRNEAGLAKLAADWPVARLVETYNSLPGVSPVKKFTDRKTAVGRIWKAIQSLHRSLPDKGLEQAHVTVPPVAPQLAEVAPSELPTDRRRPPEPGKRPRRTGRARTARPPSCSTCLSARAA
jgi:hypothetical protein